MPKEAEENQTVFVLPKDLNAYKEFLNRLPRIIGSLKGEITKLKNRLDRVDQLLKDAHIA